MNICNKVSYAVVTSYVINTAAVVKTRELEDKQLCNAEHNNIRHTHYL